MNYLASTNQRNFLCIPTAALSVAPVTITSQVLLSVQSGVLPWKILCLLPPVSFQIIAQGQAKSGHSESISEAWRRQKEAAPGFPQQNRLVFHRIIGVKCTAGGAKELAQMLKAKHLTNHCLVWCTIYNYVEESRYPLFLNANLWANSKRTNKINLKRIRNLSKVTY